MDKWHSFADRITISPIPLEYSEQDIRDLLKRFAIRSIKFIEYNKDWNRVQRASITLPSPQIATKCHETFHMKFQ